MKARLTMSLAMAFAATMLFAKSSSDNCAYCGIGAVTPSPTPTPTPSVPSGDNCNYCGISSGSSSSGTGWSKATTRQVYVVDDEERYAGTATISTAKRSKNGSVKVKVTFKMVGGKTYTAKSTAFTPDDDGTIDASWENIKNFGDVQFTIDVDGVVDGTAGDYAFATSMNEESFTHGEHAFSVENGEYDLNEKYDLIDETIPDSYEIVTTAKKWNYGKTPSIKYKKFKEDGEKWYELVGLDDEKKTNLSSLKITFNAKKNTFKGSFKVYATNEGSIDSGKKPSLKKYSFTVTGYVSGGKCVGTATCKKLKAVWPITVE